MKFHLYAAAVLSLFSTLAFAECKEANLRSTNGTQISIDYSSLGQSNGDWAWVDPTVHVTLPPNGCGASSVTVELIGIENPNGYTKAQQVTLTRSTRNACEFIGSTTNLETWNHGGVLRQQIAVAIDWGTSIDWLVDPTQSYLPSPANHNFNYSFDTGYSPQTEACQ